MSEPQDEVIAEDPRSRRMWVSVTAGLVCVGVGVRLLLNFSYACPPGTDAAYYPMQARALLTHGHLMYTDLPLLFWADAALARLFVAGGLPLDSAVLVASRLIDCLAEPLVAIPLMALGYRWSGGRRSALVGCVAATIPAVLSPPIATLSGGFQKTSVGLVWIAAAAWATAAVLDRPTARRRVLLLAALALLALTHVGAFGVAVVMVGATMVVWMWIRGRRTSTESHWRQVAWIGGLLVVSIGLLARLDPRRAAATVAAPFTFFVPPLSSPWGVDPTGKMLARVVIVVAIAGAWAVWRRRREPSGSDIALVAGSVLTLALLVCPKNVNYVYRLLLMTPVPASIVLISLMARRARETVSGWPAYALLAASFAVAVVSPLWASRPVITASQADELRGLAASIPDPDSTLVVATHGLEWFAGYLLRTPVRTAGYGRRRYALPADTFSRYRRVLLIRVRPGVPWPLAAMEPTSPPDPAFVRPVHVGRDFELYEFRRPGG